MICARCLSPTKRSKSRRFVYYGVEYGPVCPACRIAIRNSRKALTERMKVVKPPMINELERLFFLEARTDFIRKKKNKV